jgi:putative heme-binding domain-containing protein
LLLLSAEPQKVGDGMYKTLINPDEPESIQAIALNSYIQQSGTVASSEIIRVWNTLTPAIRNIAIDNFLKSPAHMNLLLDAVEKKQIQPSTIGWGRMVELMNNDDVPVKNRARKLLSGQAVDQDELFKKYAGALTANGDRSKGSAIFQKTCSTCHQIGGSNGKAFGPDLASIRNRDAQFIMADILNPNRSIADGFELWIVETNEGKKISGIISSETSSTITIKDAAGTQSTIPRSAIKNIEAGSISAMPQGLQSAITVSEMSDLLAFLKRPQ